MKKIKINTSKVLDIKSSSKIDFTHLFHFIKKKNGISHMRVFIKQCYKSKFYCQNSQNLLGLDMQDNNNTQLPLQLSLIRGVSSGIRNKTRQFLRRNIFMKVIWVCFGYIHHSFFNRKHILVKTCWKYLN